MQHIFELHLLTETKLHAGGLGEQCTTVTQQDSSRALYVACYTERFIFFKI